MSVDNFIVATYPVANAGVGIALLGPRGNSRFMGSFFDKKYSDGCEKSRFIILNNKNIFVTLSNIQKQSQNDYTHLQNKQIALILIDVTDRNALNNIETYVEDVKHSDIKATFLVATRCDKAKDRVITSDQIKAKALDLKLNGFLEINAKDKSLVKQAVDIAVSYVTKPEEAPHVPVKKNENPSMDKLLNQFAVALERDIKDVAQKELNPKIEELKTELKSLKAHVLDMQSSPWSNFVNWLSNLFSCFNIFKKTVEPKFELPNVDKF